MPYLYMMFPLSRAFILPHCPFSKASYRGQKVNYLTFPLLYCNE